MSVSLTMKPLKGDAFQVDIDPEKKVADLKAMVAEQRAEFPANAQKLIYSGKILADDAVINTLDIKPDGFIVVMVAKAVAPAPAAAAAPAATPAATAPTVLPAAAVLAAGTPAVAAPQLPQVILDMKNSPRFKELTMVVARNPRVLAQMIPALGQWTALQNAIQDNMEGFVSWLMQEAASEAMMANLANNPNLPPELQQAMRENPQAVAAALAAHAGGGGGLPGAPGGGGPGAAPMQMSPEDEAAIGRLAEMGFDKTMAAQAYFACEKNEELAANFLLSGGDDMQT